MEHDENKKNESREILKDRLSREIRCAKIDSLQDLNDLVTELLLKRVKE